MTQSSRNFNKARGLKHAYPLSDVPRRIAPNRICPVKYLRICT
jgi:hypothetical protein